MAAISVGGHPPWHFILAGVLVTAMFVTVRVAGGWRPLRRSPTSWLPPALGGWAAGSTAYAVVLAGLARWPSIVDQRVGGGVVRIACIGPVTAVTTVVAWRYRRGPAASATPLVLVGLGGAWTAWGLVDQHILRTFALTPGSALAGPGDALFHGVGLATAGLGTWLATRSRVSHLPLSG